MTEAPKIAVRQLGMEYDGQPVLERINLTVPTGAFCTIVGASGCGKSTFLRLLLSQERPTRGQILIDGADLPPEPTPDRGIVFQRYSVFPHLTVEENLILADEFDAAPFWGACSARPGGRQGSGWRRRWRKLAWRPPGTATRRSSPVACSSASPSPRRS